MKNLNAGKRLISKPMKPIKLLDLSPAQPFPIPDNMTYLFWDIDINLVDKIRHKKLIIERILRLGRPESISWLLNIYTNNEIIEVVKKTRNIDRKTANYWAIHFGIPREEIVCLNMQFQTDCFY
jgi:hypothetical protein